MQQLGGDDEERESAGEPPLHFELVPVDTYGFSGSAEGSSDDEKDAPEQTDAMEVEVEAEADIDAEGENEYENDENEEEDDEPDPEGSQDSFGGNTTQRSRIASTFQPSSSGNRSTQGLAFGTGATIPGPTSHPNPATLQPSVSHSQSSLVRLEALTAPVYDIVPTIAAPHSTSINAITATPDLRWVFSGGSDGYIRKFNWLETANGKSMLTVAQKHPFVDSVTKAGVLMSYWENEDSQRRFSIWISRACPY